MRNGSQVTRNTAVGASGGIHATGDVTLLDTSSVINNESGTVGGRIYISSPATKVTLRGSSIIADNTATNGGAIFSQLGDDTQADFFDSSCVWGNSLPQCVGETCPVCPPL